MKLDSHFEAHKRSRKDKNKQLSHPVQKQIVYQFLLKNTATASMVEAVTGVKQKNICRYKRELQDQNLLWEVICKGCQITGCDAWYLTTNPELAPKSKTVQTSMF